jgi:hypothetical protein
VITDDGAPPASLDMLRAAGIEVQVVEVDAADVVSAA